MVNKQIGWNVSSKFNKGLHFWIIKALQPVHLFLEDFQKIVSKLKSNGYPYWYINKQIRLFFNKRHKSAESTISSCATDKNCNYLGADIKEEEIFLLRLPYLPKVLLQIEKEIRKFITKKLPGKFRFTLIHDTYKWQSHQN